SCSSTTLFSLFSFNHTPTPAIYTLSLHDALPIYRSLLLSSAVGPRRRRRRGARGRQRPLRRRPHDGVPAQARLGGRCIAQRGQRDRKSTRLNSSHVKISYAVFCLKKKKKQKKKKV